MSELNARMKHKSNGFKANKLPSQISLHIPIISALSTVHFAATKSPRNFVALIDLIDSWESTKSIRQSTQSFSWFFRFVSSVIRVQLFTREERFSSGNPTPTSKQGRIPIATRNSKAEEISVLCWTEIKKSEDWSDNNSANFFKQAANKRTYRPGTEFSSSGSAFRIWRISGLPDTTASRCWQRVSNGSVDGEPESKKVIFELRKEGKGQNRAEVYS